MILITVMGIVEEFLKRSRRMRVILDDCGREGVAEFRKVLLGADLLVTRLKNVPATGVSELFVNHTMDDGVAEWRTVRPGVLIFIFVPEGGVHVSKEFDAGLVLTWLKLGQDPLSYLEDGKGNKWRR